MRRLRVSRKAVQPARKQPSTNARDIILSIFSQQIESDKLQYTKSNWNNSPKFKKSTIVDSSMKAGYQPLRYLYPFLETISNGLDLDVCSYLFVDGDILRVAYKERRMVISKTKFSCSKIKYWLSHIYFSSFRNKLAQNLLEAPKNTERDTINSYEEKEYMPKILRGLAKQSAPFIRKIKVSPEGHYRRNGQHEKQSFCIVYNKNGSEQELSFSQVLSFVDYQFNLKEIIYIKILPKNTKNNLPIGMRYSKLNETQDEIEILTKFRSLYSKVAGWQMLRDEMEDRKFTQLAREHYENYCNLLQLEAVAFIEVRNTINVEILQTSWILSKSNGVILTNVFRFTTMESKLQNSFCGLETLYKKMQNDKSSRSSSKNSSQYRRIKTEEKQKTSFYQLFNLPLFTVQKETKQSSRLDSYSDSIFRTKGKSCLIRGTHNLFT